MGSFRIRYLDSEIPLAEGDFVIGRSPACHLILDSPRVSRRHARIRVKGNQMTIDDLDSREGVLLNGAFVKEAQTIAPGDKIRIADHEIAVVFRSGPVSVTRSDLPAQKEDDPDLSTAPSTLLFDLAQKAIADRNVEEAEWIVGKILAEIHYRLSSAQPVRPDTLDFASSACIRVAELTGKATWLDGLFEIHRLGRTFLTAHLIDALGPLVARSRYPEPARLVAYVKSLQQAATTSVLKADQIALLVRLEKLLETAG